MAHGFTIPLFTSILEVSILEASEASAFAFASTLAVSASTTLYCINKTPPSPNSPYLPYDRFYRYIKDILGAYRLRKCIVFLTLFFCQPCFCIHLTIVLPFFCCDIFRVSVCHPLLDHLYTTTNGSTLLPSTQTSCLGVILYHVNIFISGEGIYGARAVVYYEIINKKIFCEIHFHSSGCRAQMKVNQKLSVTAVAELI